MKEIWKDIKGYEGYYQISNKGKVKSLPRLRNAKNKFISRERILKNQDNSKGYLRVELKANNKKQKFFVHRLVAEHFLDKPKGCNIVNHLDCNPHNNNVENLEWTTFKGNSRYMKEQVERDNTRMRDLQKQGYEVIRFSGTEIWHRPYKCASDILNIILSKCKYIKEVK